MFCPNCKNSDSSVIDSRFSEKTNRVRRRRECLSCGLRYTTCEFIVSEFEQLADLNISLTKVLRLEKAEELLTNLKQLFGLDAGK